jgi:hypothetical protein
MKHSHHDEEVVRTPRFYLLSAPSSVFVLFQKKKSYFRYSVLELTLCAAPNGHISFNARHSRHACDRVQAAHVRSSSAARALHRSGSASAVLHPIIGHGRPPTRDLHSHSAAAARSSPHGGRAASAAGAGAAATHAGAHEGRDIDQRSRCRAACRHSSHSLLVYLVPPFFPPSFS